MSTYNFLLRVFDLLDLIDKFLLQLVDLFLVYLDLCIIKH